MTRGLTKLVWYYSGLALLILNTVVAFIGLNVILYGANSLKDLLGQKKTSTELRYGSALLARAYPGYEPKAITDLLNETWGPALVSAPYTEFRERPRSGKYVNVHPGGFRVSKNQGPWPPDPNADNVFMFGGSTTFSYGLHERYALAEHDASQVPHALGGRLRRVGGGRTTHASAVAKRTPVVSDRDLRGN